MAEYYKQRHLSPKERDEAFTTIAVMGLTLAGAGILLANVKKNDRGAIEGLSAVGRLLDDTQTSLDLEFDDELNFATPYRPAYNPAAHPDIEAAWAAMENRPRPWSAPGYDGYIDADTEDEYPLDTVFEVYKVPRYSANGEMSLVHSIEGEDLINASRIIKGDIQKAKKFGYDLYIFQDGIQTKFVPGVYGISAQQQEIDFDAAPATAVYICTDKDERRRRLRDLELHRLGFKVYAGENNDLVYVAGCKR